MNRKFCEREILCFLISVLNICDQVLSVTLEESLFSMKCRIFSYCCNDFYIKNDLQELKKNFEDNLFGQNLATQVLLFAIKSHLTDPQPKKALVLSLHGSTGIGKNHAVKLIAESLYKYGMKSEFVHLFLGEIHFSGFSNIKSMKIDLRNYIIGNVTLCPYQMFIFDEMERISPDLLNGIQPFMDYYEHIDNVDFRNMGGTFIANVTYTAWLAGKKRDDIKLSDLEGLLTLSSYNTEGGLFHSFLIKHHLIDHFIPFLPLERRHVQKCLKQDLIRLQMFITEEEEELILNDLIYFPPSSHLFSESGCKKIQSRLYLFKIQKLHTDL